MSNAKIPAAHYHAIAGLFARVHNNGLSLADTLSIMGATLGKEKEVEFADLPGWKAERIENFAERKNIALVPARLGRVMQAIAFVTPTTPLCTNPACAQFTITNERGCWEVVPPGKSCPICNVYTRPTVVVTKRVHWFSGTEVEITQEFDRSGAEPIPLTEHGILDFVTQRRKKTIDDYITRVVDNELQGIPDPYLRLLNVLACHPKFNGHFPRGAFQIISALWSPDSFGLIENELQDLGVLARQQWWVRGMAATPVSVQPTPAVTSGKIKIVCLFAPEDRRYAQDFFKHMAVIRRNHADKLEIILGSDSVPPGGNAAAELRTQLAAAKIILLFESPEYGTDDSLYEAQAQALKDNPSAQRVPVLIRPCTRSHPTLQPLPRSGRFISQYKQADEGWQEVVGSAGLGTFLYPLLGISR